MPEDAVHSVTITPTATSKRKCTPETIVTRIEFEFNPESGA